MFISNSDFLIVGMLAVGSLGLIYLARINYLLKQVPVEVQKFLGPEWTAERLKRTYRELEEHPITFHSGIPPKLERRYVVTGGNGLVGGFVVLQLLSRGTPPMNIRILDIRKPERNDMAKGLAKEVEFIQTDISSSAAVNAAFEKPWDSSITHLPLTVFHTAAVIIPSDRSRFLYAFPEAVNVRGTQNVLAASIAAGADIFSATSSASISIRPVEPFVFWAKEPNYFWQFLDERDFFQPLRTHEEFFGNYAASKATAERLVCNANTRSFRTGCIRPANGVYGNPTDNTVGGPLSSAIFPTWIPHIVQNFAHGANVAVAHLQHEAVLVSKDAPQAGRPFVVTDPNPPISYRDLYNLVSTLSIHPFRAITLPPALVLLLSYAIEWYQLLPYRFPLLNMFYLKLGGNVKHLQPGLFSICTHLIAKDEDARRPVKEGGLGYEGLVTTLQGMAWEVLEWNREHLRRNERVRTKKSYTISVSLADQLQRSSERVSLE
ncbi:hypothetical protein S7711_08538 [Stachybotrys chartarum IBT 7711]|uniref:3-beta hydroxysteroid dehydrogenase/isomerase domain-containing protein n=1 Tax=Stachybotrys chartarum (strain CBS 109288 / IBT 7711) TaxID=1280523 RepID=A0A084AZW0_STACB|nr:hypothetical protein S7711_08538 [Stachybotrys chartarum IBT 7711]